jgi:cytochrome P450
MPDYRQIALCVFFIIFAGTTNTHATSAWSLVYLSLFPEQVLTIASNYGDDTCQVFEMDLADKFVLLESKIDGRKRKILRKTCVRNQSSR